MVKSMFAGVAGLKAHQQMMDVIGNNIANVNTPGYKSGSITFQDSIYQTIRAASGGNIGAGGYGGNNPSQVGYGVSVSGIAYDMSQGGIMVTGRGMDCMIKGTGFFIVGPMRGEGAGDITWEDGGEGTVDGADISGSGLLLTRVGQFSVDGNGYLVDGNKNYVYGRNVQAGTETNVGTGDAGPQMQETLTPIRVPPLPGGADGARYKVTGYTFQADGTIVGTTDTDQQITIGKLALASVENPDGLAKSSSYYYSVTDNTGTVRAVDGGGATGLIDTNGLEMAKVELANEFSSLILAQRGFQANSKIITVTDSMLEELVNMKR